MRKTGELIKFRTTMKRDRKPITKRCSFSWRKDLVCRYSMFTTNTYSMPSNVNENLKKPCLKHLCRTGNFAVLISCFLLTKFRELRTRPAQPDSPTRWSGKRISMLWQPTSGGRLLSTLYVGWHGQSTLCTGCLEGYGEVDWELRCYLAVQLSIPATV